jgi:phage terminase large subunit-like protein
MGVLTGTERMMRYAADVEAGKVLACEALRHSVARFRKDLAASKKKACRWEYEPETADKIVRNIERLKHFEDPFAGKPIHLEPWECFFVCQLYGWKDKATGFRRFKKALLFMGRKQGKTILASALALNEIKTRPGVEAYSLATKQLISNKSFKNLQMFIHANGHLSSSLVIHKSPKSIECPSTGSVFLPLSSDSSLDGLNPSYAIIDELAAQDNGEAYSILTSGMGSRPERLTIIISTAAASLDNPLIEEYEYAKKVLAESIEDAEFLVSIYEFDKGDAWDDLTLMQKSCPNLGVTVNLDYYAGELKKAKVIPIAALEYKTKYCNLWQVSSQTWIPDTLWARSRKNAKKYQPTTGDLASAPCVIGVDFSTIWDYTAVTRYFYLAERGVYYALHRFYIPGDQVETKAHQENPAIRRWIEEGLIVATPGESIDYQYLYKDVEGYLEAHNVLAITYDPAKAREFETVMGSRATIIPFPQKSAHLSPAAKAWEKAIVEGQVADDNPVVRWMLSNTINKANPDSGSYFITKQDIGKARKRIDGVITSIMAFSVLQAQVVSLSNKPFIPDFDALAY